MLSGFRRTLAITHCIYCEDYKDTLKKAARRGINQVEYV